VLLVAVGSMLPFGVRADAAKRGKLSVVTTQKAKLQAVRQSAALRQNGL
jgi:hypothetical protein